MPPSEPLKPGWQSEEPIQRAPKRHLHTQEEYHSRRSQGGRKGGKVAASNRKLDQVLGPVEDE